MSCIMEKNSFAEDARTVHSITVRVYNPAPQAMTTLTGIERSILPSADDSINPMFPTKLVDAPKQQAPVRVQRNSCRKSPELQHSLEEQGKAFVCNNVTQMAVVTTLPDFCATFNGEVWQWHILVCAAVASKLLTLLQMCSRWTQQQSKVAAIGGVATTTTYERAAAVDL